MIKALGIAKSYQSVQALKPTHLQIDHEQLVAITGPSGAGKSTLLHLLSGLEPTDVGEVILNGQSLKAIAPKQLQLLRNQTLGFVFQFHYLLPEFTALENVMMPLLIGGVKEDQAKLSAEKILYQVGLSERVMHKPDQLSGGEQQRVAIARAVIHRPKILFADEPTGNLDSQTTEAVFNLFLDLKKALGMTIVLVTHNALLAEKADRILFVKDGQIL